MGKWIVPIICIVAAVVSVALAIFGVTLAVITPLFKLFGAFAIVIILIGFTIAVCDCGLSFAMQKSKLCIASGVISALAAITDIVAFILLV